MEIHVSSSQGFCNGVRRAVRIATGAAERYGRLRTDGPLVHNRQVAEYLARRGVSDDAPSDVPFLVRAHGIAPAKRDALLADGAVIIDATCPRIAQSQHLAHQAAMQGHTVVLAGDRDHAEVLAVAGAAEGACIVVSTLADLALVPDGVQILFIAQTTFSVELFEAMARELGERFPHCQIIDTMCRATHQRQEDAARVAAIVDTVVVVGGQNSANTRRLAEIVQAAGSEVVQVETADELRAERFQGKTAVGVVSGASTPDWEMDRVLEWLRECGGTSA